MLPNQRRRQTLRTIGSGLGLGIGLPISQVAVRGSQRADLLPADEAQAIDPKVEKHVENPDDVFDVVVNRAQAYKHGLATVSTRAQLNGGYDLEGQIDVGPKGDPVSEPQREGVRGEVSMDGSAHLRSTWVAQESGRHQVVLKAEQSGLISSQRTWGTDTDVVLSSDPNLSVSNTKKDEIIKTTSAIETNAVNSEAPEYVIEQLLSRLTRVILLPKLGPIGKILADFILDEVFDYLIDVRPESASRIGSRQMDLIFDATKGEEYEFQFTTHNGFSGRTTDGGFNANSTTRYEVDDFYVEPI